MIPDIKEIEQVHSRVIEIRSYTESPTRMIFTATLTEKRLTPYFLSTGEPLPPGELHNLKITLAAIIPEMYIDDIEVEMIEVPREDCRGILEAFNKVKGMKIEPGFAAKIKQMLGGTAGCTHLVHLLLTLAPAAMQGMWAEKSRKKQNGLNPERLKKMSGILIDTCYAWRKEGSAALKLKAMIDKKSQQS